MRKFSELGISPPDLAFTGEKIKMTKILNKEVILCDYKITDTKYPKNKSGKCLHIQIEIENVKFVLFTGSDILITMVQEIKKDDLPLLVTIIQQGECYLFS